MRFFNFGNKPKTKTGATMAAVMLLAVPLVGQSEGLKYKAYLDAVGIPTICYGETQGVKMGQVKSRAECDTMLAVRLAYFAQQVDLAVEPPMSAETHAALASWTYNIGVGAMKNSSTVRSFNAGEPVAGCNAMLKWNRATIKGKKVVLSGLTARREKERELCLKGLK